MQFLRTVLGDIDATTMGVTLSHEHLVCDSSVWLQPPADALAAEMASVEPSLENLWWMRQFPNSNPSVLQMTDETRAIDELAPFAANGGATIIELTCSAGLGRNVRALERISRASAVHVVASTGHYIAASHGPDVAAASIDELAETMVAEIERGVGDTGIRCGVIGEIGLSWPLHPDEIRVLRAAGRAQQATGAGVTVHTAAHAVDEDSALIAADILEREGADLSRVVMGHMDTSLHRLDYHRAVLARGCYLEYDLFGHEFFESENSFQSFGDTERVRAVATLVLEGAAAQLLLSHDICYTIQLQRYGGYGYAHLLRNITPRLVLAGVDLPIVRSILTDNPRAAFAVARDTPRNIGALRA
jgi:phosphotriesterase-related protein